jgi:hypothetical protein
MDGIFVYHGEDENLKREMEVYGDRINKAYSAFFRPEEQRRIKESNRTTLTAASFFHDREELRKQLGISVPAQTPDKYGLLSGSESVNGVVWCAPFFYISAQNFAHGGSARFTDKKIASYIHEFDHYIIQALQSTPLNSIHERIHSFLGTSMTRFDFPLYLKQLATMPLNNPEKVERAVVAAYDPLLTQNFEKATRILDHVILGSIGIKTPLNFRGRWATKNTFFSFGKEISFPDESSDPFVGLSDRKAIDEIIQWENSYKLPKDTAPKMYEILEEAKKRKYRRMPLEVILDKIEVTNASRIVEQEGSGI